MELIDSIWQIIWQSLESLKTLKITFLTQIQILNS